MAATTLPGTGSAFLTATVEDLLRKLSSSDFIHYIKYSDLNVLKLTVLETKLLTLHSVLHDAEQKQFFNPKIKQWMDELYNAISFTEDLFDEIGYDSLKCKVENTQPRFDLTFIFEIKVMCLRLHLFVQQIDTLGLQCGVSRSKRIESVSVIINESVIVGRNDDKERLIDMLLSDSSDNNLGVIAILGVGGVGKSTIARLVYNDRKVDEHFDLKVWVRVLEDFDVLGVTKAIYESIFPGTCAGKDLNHIRVLLKRELMCRRFLFVLDDMWNDSYNDWNNLITSLFNGNCGSRVIITTRYENVAKVVHTFPMYK